ncbi:UNVERIFIED_CONTAM: Sacsin [Sesamum radiatum]|uniref:Sacsin n=1 Tax=Sesamum radiatum TaxID=300843 RepID=A0AAW2R2Q0_SESRA
MMQAPPPSAYALTAGNMGLTLLSDSLAQWQGPALLAYNDAVFTEEDFVSISRIGGSSKHAKPWKTGRFGVGFNSVYHLTDLPSFVSGKHVVLFDPQGVYLPNVSTANPGKRIEYVTSKAISVYKDQFFPYCAFGCDMKSPFHGTLFRFPLRNADQAANRKTYSCSINSANDDVVWHRKALQRFSKLNYVSDCEMDAFSLDFLSEAVVGGLSQIRTHKFYVVQTMASPSSRIGSFAATAAKDYDMHLLPWASVAACVSDDSLNDDHLKLGRAFCFLPLPVKTGFRVHINGYFEVFRIVVAFGMVMIWTDLEKFVLSGTGFYWKMLWHLVLLNYFLACDNYWLGMPIVPLPSDLFEMILNCKSDGHQKVVTPDSVRHYLRDSKYLSTLGRLHNFLLLEYCLEDLIDADVGIHASHLPLLPLASGDYGSLSRSSEGIVYYICNELEYMLLQQISNRLIDRTIPVKLLCRLTSIANVSGANLVVFSVNEFVQLFSEFVPAEWKYKMKVLWSPSSNSTHPASSWFLLFWRYLQEQCEELSLFGDWPIIPAISGHLYRPSRQKKLLNLEKLSEKMQHVLVKIGCTILDSTYCIEHPDLINYVHDADAPGILDAIYDVSSSDGINQLLQCLEPNERDELRQFLLDPKWFVGRKWMILTHRIASGSQFIECMMENLLTISSTLI